MICKVVKYLSIVTIILLISIGRLRAEGSIGGLSFCADKLTDRRTSYQLFSTAQKISEYIKIDLSLQIAPFSSIGHLITCKGSHHELFNVIAYRHIDKLYIDLNILDSNEKISLELNPEELIGNQWSCLSIDYSVKESYVEISFNGSTQRISLGEVERDDLYNLTFGVCDHYLPLVEFAIKDLSVDIDGELSTFALDQLNGNEVYSDDHKVMGYVMNPIWLRDRHKQWRKLFSIDSNEVANIELDSSNHKLVIYSSEQVLIYDISTGELQAVEPPQNPSFATLLGGGCNSLLDRSSGEIFMFNSLPGSDGEYTVATYDYKSNLIAPLSSERLFCRYHQHSIFSDQNGDNIYLFGGYGRYAYFNSFQCYSKDQGRWSECAFSGDTISPRHYTAVGSREESGTLATYLFGGYGNRSGLQRDGGQYCKDLYRVDTRSRSVERISDFDQGEFDMVPCQDILLDDDQPIFYTMCYKQYEPSTYARLYLFDWQHRSYRAVSDSIPLVSKWIATKVHLFEDRASNQLFCVTQEFSMRDQSTINVYSIRTPLALVFDSSREDSSYIYIYIALLSILILLVIVVLYFSKQRYKATVKPCCPEQIGDHFEQESSMIPTPSRNSISLMGRFAVIDREGVDITHLFANKIRHLLFTILLSSRSEMDGIHSRDILSVVWPEKSPDKARNLRGVNIKRLRDILAYFDGVELTCTNQIWRLEIDEQRLSCDYIELLNILEDENYTLHGDAIEQIISILNRGALLYEESFESLDVYKSEIESQLLLTFTPKVEQMMASREYSTASFLAQALLKIDPLNREIAKMAVKSLLELGYGGRATVLFRQFVLQYQKIYNEDIIYDEFIR